jgi:hypothetical protein
VSRNPTIVTTLVDSGAIKANYIDVMLFNRLKAEGSRVITLAKRKRVSSALAGEDTQEIKEAIEVLIVMMNEITSKEESLILTFNPIKFKESSPFQMIIGLPSKGRIELLLSHLQFLKANALIITPSYTRSYK